LVWTFNNINLPDSISNEAESHGYIYFKIKPQADIAEGAILDNQAAIFFDNLEPVITNTVTNIIGEERGELATEGELQLFPNPMVNETNVSILPLDGAQVDIESIYLYDGLGNLLLSKLGVGKREVELIRGNMAPGYYLVKVKGGDGKEYIGKLLVP
ncbi:MAG: T9SS type A sorting domain-containing protein, partial [Bacteroidota bacterium]